ncbi:hypothetical protein ACF0H5_007106 [Mactra antiquata]
MTNNTHRNITEVEANNLLQTLSARVITLIADTEDQLHKIKCSLKSHLALDCVESVFPDLDLVLDCDNLTLQVNDEFKTCMMSVYKSMAVMSKSIDILKKWNSVNHYIMEDIDISRLGTYMDQFICDFFIKIFPLFGNGSELLNFVPQPVRLISDLTDENSNKTLLDLKYFNNKKCGTLHIDVNQIQTTHFVYQFIYDVSELSKRLYSMLVHTSSTSVDQISSTPQYVTSHCVTPHFNRSDLSVVSMSSHNTATTEPFEIIIGKK